DLVTGVQTCALPICAGKTTTLATITGVVPPRDGRIAYRAADVAGRPPEEIARRGIGLVPQGRRIFPNLTVLENLTIARRGTSGCDRKSVVEGRVGGR